MQIKFKAREIQKEKIENRKTTTAARVGERKRVSVNVSLHAVPVLEWKRARLCKLRSRSCLREREWSRMQKKSNNATESAIGVSGPECTNNNSTESTSSFGSEEVA